MPQKKDPEGWPGYVAKCDAGGAHTQTRNTLRVRGVGGGARTHFLRWLSPGAAPVGTPEDSRNNAASASISCRSAVPPQRGGSRERLVVKPPRQGAACHSSGRELRPEDGRGFASACSESRPEPSPSWIVLLHERRRLSMKERFKHSTRNQRARIRPAAWRCA